MALTMQTMTDEQRKSVAIEYLRAFDNGGVTSTGGSILDLFADDAQVYFPKWGPRQRQGRDRKMFWRCRRNAEIDHPSLFALQLGVFGERRHRLRRHKPWRAQGRPWRAGVPEWAAGRWCDVFEIRDWKIQRCFIYLDPDYAGKDTERYP